ncbi:hypothetical protein [uncultured Paenibacillus sp.]|uniref:hypothetical protein n=1 Tax=uncultured Paenibacillus sp. TaxID=227322 RepID=UPI0028052AD8|nr:hypothetical protein [uncultured Paenibacillus sp.]
MSGYLRSILKRLISTTLHSRANEQSGDSNRNATSVEVGKIDLKIDLKPKHLVKNNRYTKVTSNGTKVV